MSVDKKIRDLVFSHFVEQFPSGKNLTGEEPLSAAIAEAVLSSCFDCFPISTVHHGDPSPAEVIAGFAFGNRLDAHGNRIPGPINKRLYDLVVAYYKAVEAKHAAPRVVVQWEIGAYHSDEDIPSHVLTILEPQPQSDLTKEIIKYISGRVFAEYVLSMIDPSNSIVVVAHPDHIHRCTKTFEDLGCSRSIPIKHDDPHDPTWYDPQSGQLWTRHRHLYVLHDMINRLSMHREAMNRLANKTGVR